MTATTTRTRSSRNDPAHRAGRVPCPVEGCTSTTENQASMPAHIAMAHPEVPMDTVAPRRPAPTTSAAAPEPSPDGSAQRAPVAVELATPGAAPAAGGLPVELAIADIVVEDNVREDLGDLDQLVESVREHGLLQAVLVDRVDGAWRLVDGHRRLEACRRAGLDVVPVQVAPRRFDGGERKTVQVVANALRKDLDPIEEARAYRHILSAEKGLTQAELARRLSIAPSTLANALRLLEAPAPVQALLTAGSLSPAHVKAILGLPEASAVRLAERAAKEGYSAHTLEDSAKWERQQVADAAKRAKASESAAKAAVSTLAGSVPMGTSIIVSCGYQVDAAVVRAAIEKVGHWPIVVGWGETPDGCGCTTVQLNVGPESAATEIVCLDPEHRLARQAAHDAKRKATEATAEAERAELQAAVEAALCAVPPTVLRLLLRAHQGYSGRTWTEYRGMADGDVAGAIASSVARAWGAKAMPVAKVIEALRAEASA